MTDILITEVNSDATGGDFFELYNYGDTPIDLTGWRWTDSAGATIITFPPGTTLAAGQRLLVLSGTDAAAFRTGWGLPDDLTVIALGGPGLGGGDGVVVVDGTNSLVAGFNYGTANFSAPASMGSHVISPSSKSGGGTAAGGHAGPSFGGGHDKVSAVWDGVSTAEPAYTSAVAGTLGAYVHTTNSNSIGSPGVVVLAEVVPPTVLITEVNSNAAGGDFFELYNYGDTAIDLTGWKWIDDAANPEASNARDFTGLTGLSLAAGATLIVITDATNMADFRAKWGIDSSVQVISGTTAGPGLGGSGDAIVVFDADGKVATAMNYKTTNVIASDDTVIAPVIRTDGNPVVSGHAGVAVGATAGSNGVSAVWDGVDPLNPKYQPAVVGQNGAFAQPDAAGNIGSPGAVAPDVLLTYSTTTFNESRAFDGSVSGGIVITLTGDTFTGNDGDSLLGVATLAHTPAGLTAVLTRTSATTATLTFTGTATNHADAQDVNNLTLTFLNGAFANGNANSVGGNGNSDLKIDFSEPATGTQEFKPGGQGSDASTALALDANYMVVGDDEANVLRVYDRKGGEAVALHNHNGATAWNYGSLLSISDELDLEGGTRIGDTYYFTGSSGNKKAGDDHSSRENLFSVQITGTGADTTFSGAAKLGNDNLEALLVAWDSSNVHGKGANYFGFATASAGGVIPENTYGFSIEGLTAKADSNTLLLGFRAPQTSTTTRDTAVIVELNLGAGGSLSGASFGAAHELNLGGRGIRSIEKSATGDYLILAGPAGGASLEVTHDFRLFRWDGVSATPTELNVDLDALREGTGGSFETIVDVLSTAEGTWVQLLQDNGDTIWDGQTQVSKDLPGSQQQFLGNWVQIGGDVTDTNGPVLQTSSPADDAGSVAVGANLVLRFDEGVKRGTGSIVIKKASDGSTVAVIDVSDTTQVSVAFNTVTINPAADLDANTGYYVEAAAEALTDHYGNAWGGLSGSAALNFTTGAPLPPPKVLITEVNSNAAGGDFFELYNYGDTAIDLTGWKWVDDKANPDHGDAREFTGVTQLAAGARLIVITDSTNIADFRAKWGIDSSVQVISGATAGPGLGGSGDAVVVFDADGKLATALNYKTVNVIASDSTVIEPVTRTDGNPVVSGHAGVAVGATAGSNGVSAVWDGVDPVNPKYQPAVAGQNGAFAQSGTPANIGSPGKVKDDGVDAPRFVSIAATDANKPEGNSGSTAFTFTVTRTGEDSGAVSVQWTVAGSGANPAEAADFQDGELPAGGTLHFAAYETSKTITIEVAGDFAVEPDELFTVTLANPTDANILAGGASAQGVILNDDVLPPLPPAPPPPPPPPPPPGEPVVVEGSAGNDVIVIPDDQPFTTIITGGGDDVIRGGAGTETVVVPATLDEVLQLGMERDSNGTLVLNTPTGSITLQGVERVYLSDGHLIALDVELPTPASPGGHTGQVLALAYAGLGLVLDESSAQRLSEWVRMADELDSFSVLAQALIDVVAPGVSNKSLVSHLFLRVMGKPANENQLAFWVSRIGADQPYETQGELLAMVATLPEFTEPLANLIGTSEVLLDASVFGLV